MNHPLREDHNEQQRGDDVVAHDGLIVVDNAKEEMHNNKQHQQHLSMVREKMINVKNVQEQIVELCSQLQKLCDDLINIAQLDYPPQMSDKELIVGEETSHLTQLADNWTLLEMSSIMESNSSKSVLHYGPMIPTKPVYHSIGMVSRDLTSIEQSSTIAFLHIAKTHP